VSSFRQNLFDVQCPTSLAYVGTHQAGRRTAINRPQRLPGGRETADPPQSGDLCATTKAIPGMVRHDRCRAGRPRTTGASRRQAPDRLTRTSGDFVIVEVRLRANTPEVLARPSGLPSPVPDPAQPRWESADHRTTQRRRPRRPPERRRSTAGSRSSLCLASSTSAVMRLRASHRSYSCRRIRTHHCRSPGARRPTSPRHNQSASHEWHPRPVKG
jgi:hypothetical protein